MRPCERLAVGPDQSRLAVPQGSSLTTIGSPRSRFAREADGRAELALRLEERHGDLGIGIEPVQLEPAVPRGAVHSDRSTPESGSRSALRMDSAEHPGIADRLAIRPDHPSRHRHAAAERDLDFLAADARFQVEEAKAVRVVKPAARLARRRASDC